MATEITRLLGELNAGRPRAAEDLLQAVYGELRKLATAQLARLHPGQTLQPTALVHEAYLKLIGNVDPGWQGRGHFYGAAAQAMREIIVDYFRSKSASKRGGGRPNLDIKEAIAVCADSPVLDDVLAVDKALKNLSAEHPRKAKVVVMRYFGGLSDAEIAESLGLTARTVERDWRFARAYLRSLISAGAE